MPRVQTSMFVLAALVGDAAGLHFVQKRSDVDATLPRQAEGNIREMEHPSTMPVHGPASEVGRTGAAAHPHPPHVMSLRQSESLGRKAFEKVPGVTLTAADKLRIEIASQNRPARSLTLAQEPHQSSGSPGTREGKEIDVKTKEDFKEETRSTVHKPHTREAKDTGVTTKQGLREKTSGRSRAVFKTAEHQHVWNDQGPLTSDYGLDYVDFSLCNVSVHSNLGGLGPDFGGEQSVRYYNVATAGGGQGIDLVITADGEYKARDASMNGLMDGDGCFGLVNLKSFSTGNRSVDLIFSFYQTGTNLSVALNKFYFTVGDFDSGRTATEHVTLYSHVHELYYVPNHKMLIEGNLSSSEGLRICSTNDGNGTNNPKDPLNLTPEQQRAAVMAEYRRQTQWKVQWAIEGGRSGRNLVFAGRSNLDSLVTTTTTTTTTSCVPRSCQVFADPHVSGFDNLDNQGPTYLAFYRGRDQNVALGKGGARMHTFDLRPVDLDAFDTGDFWLVKSEPVYIQARFRLSGEFIPDRSAIGAVAVGGPFLNNRTLLVQPLDGHVTIEGLQIPRQWSDPFHEITVRQPIDEDIEFDLPMGVRLKFKRFPKHIDVKITMPPLPGGIDGECGNYDGLAENDGDDEVQSRMGDIKVADRMLLFPTKFDATLDNFRQDSSTGGNNKCENGTKVTEEQYQAVATLRDDSAMERFVDCLLLVENKMVLPEMHSELEGFIPWYSGTLATQTLKQLKEELLEQSWVQDVPVAGVFAADRSLASPGASNKRKSPAAKRPPAAGGHSKCSKCLVWGASHVLSFSAFRKHSAQHPKREALFRTQDWQKKENRQSIAEEGTYWLVNTQAVKIQGRFWMKSRKSGVLSLGALAITGPFLQGNTLAIRSGHVMWNQEEILQSKPSRFLNHFLTAEYTGYSLGVLGASLGDGMEFSFSNGMSLTVSQQHNMLEAEIRMCESHIKVGDASGQCGGLKPGSLALKSASQKAHMKLQKGEMIFPPLAPHGHS